MSNVECIQSRTARLNLGCISTRPAGPSRRGRIAGDADPGLSVVARNSEI